MTIRLERYRPGQAEEWNAFVRASKNGTFLLDRGFMDYHADRFEDHSLLLRHEDGTTVALLPANQSGADLHSHAGLTYGGLVLGDRTGAGLALTMLEAVRRYLQAAGLERLYYRTIPWIYHRHPAEEDRYALFRMDATLIRRDVLSVVPCGERLPYQDRRRRGARKATRLGVQVAETQEYGPFWELLAENLLRRHGVRPVHSLEEIILLRNRFPGNIRLFEARVEGQGCAGCVVFDTGRVAHVQYISANDQGRANHALDALFDHLLARVYPAVPYFDFGISNEDGGRTLNIGLVEQKEGFGARTVVHDHYALSA